MGQLPVSTTVNTVNTASYSSIFAKSPQTTSSPSFAYSNERDANETRKKKLATQEPGGEKLKPQAPRLYHAQSTVATHLFGTSNFICSRTHPPLLFSGLGPLFLLFILLFSQPILLNLTRGAWRLANTHCFNALINQHAHSAVGKHLRETKVTNQTNLI